MEETVSVATEVATHLDLTGHPVGWIAVALFIMAYAAVVFEERLRIAKSKPVMLAGALIWMLIAWQTGGSNCCADIL